MLLTANNALRVDGYLYLLRSGLIEDGLNLSVPAAVRTGAELQQLLEHLQETKRPEPGFLQIGRQFFAFWARRISSAAPMFHDNWRRWPVQLTDEQIFALNVGKPIGVPQIIGDAEEIPEYVINS